MPSKSIASKLAVPSTSISPDISKEAAVTVPDVVNPAAVIVPLDVSFALFLIKASSTLIVTVSVAPTDVVQFVPPAISKVFPCAIV